MTGRSRELILEHAMAFDEAMECLRDVRENVDDPLVARARAGPPHKFPGPRAAMRAS